MGKQPVQLKSGETLEISHAVKEDAAAIIDYVNQVGGESDNLTFGENEFGMSIDDEVAFLERVSIADHAIYLVAKIEGEIVGTLSFSGGHRPRICHTGEFGVSVLKRHWGKGIAKALILELIEWSRRSGIIRKLNLRVRADNEVAIRLYKSLGFIEHGVITREFQIDDVFFDSIFMGLEIDPVFTPKNQIFKVYTDDNYDKSGSSMAFIKDYDSQEEAVQYCREVIRLSIEACAGSGKTGPEVFRSWSFGGTTAFIEGASDFSSRRYAEQLCNLLYGSFDKEVHVVALRKLILDASLRFKRVNDYSESIGGGLSIRECREVAEDHAMDAINCSALNLAEYHECIIFRLNRALESVKKNEFDGSGLIAVLLREYMIPAVEGYFINEV